MMRFLRSQSQTVLVLILIVIGGSFLFYGNVGSNLLNGSGGRGNDFGRIGGQDLSVAELEDEIRVTRHAVILSGRAEQLTQPDSRAALAKEAWTRLLLLHEADRLRVQISDKELVDYIQNQPIFQKNGTYSPELYQKVMGDFADKLQITPEGFENFVREKLRLDALSDALFSTVRTSSRDVSAQYDKYEGPTQVSLITIDPKTLAGSVKVTPDQIQAEYKAHPDNPEYRTAEQRKVDFVLLPLTTEQARLPAKEKAPLIEALGEKALDFALTLQPDPSNASGHPAAPDFAAEAAKKGLSVTTTDYFAADTPPAGVPPSPTFNNAAFALTKDNPVSKVVELDSGVAVIHLNDIQPSQLKPLDQVKADIARQLQQTNAAQQAQATGQIMAKVLQEAVARGADFKTAAAAQKLTVQVLPPFVPAKVSQGDPKLETIAYVSLQLAVGQVSRAIPMEANNDVVIIHLDRRDPANPAGLSDFETHFRERQDEQARNLVIMDWATWMSRQPGTHPPPDLEAYGGVE